ncbi:MAG: transcriptional regulator GutM [Propionibacteriales bacterium]|nr:transcriptional regulator GutM [Propionibacteriales bacterium]
MTPLLLFGAVVAGLLVQAFLTLRQTSAFSTAVRGLRRHGSVAVGGAGKRYRGGTAFVAIAADDTGRVTKAISLTGWTTLARPRPLPNVEGLRLSQLRDDEPIHAVDPRARSALQNAAQTLQAHVAKSG